MLDRTFWILPTMWRNGLCLDTWSKRHSYLFGRCPRRLRWMTTRKQKYLNTCLPWKYFLIGGAWYIISKLRIWYSSRSWWKRRERRRRDSARRARHGPMVLEHDKVTMSVKRVSLGPHCMMSTSDRQRASSRASRLSFRPLARKFSTLLSVAADALLRMRRKLPLHTLLRTLRSAICIRQRVALLYGKYYSDPGHEYMIRVLKYCYQRLISPPRTDGNAGHRASDESV